MLAARAVPRAAAGGADLLDRRPAPVARLAGAPVDLELALHSSPRPIRQRVVAQRRPLASNSVLERTADRAVERAQLLRREVARGCQWMNTRTPKRLVGVDVADSGNGTLVEDRSLDRRPPRRKPRREVARAERRVERLAADSSVDVRVQLGRIEHEPRAEASDVAIGDVRSVV